MKYLTHKRFRQRAICGEVNIPALTECESVNGMICLGDKQLCLIYSENAHLYFARNDDGNGLERGQLTCAIIELLTKKDYLLDGYDEKYERKIKAHNERADEAWEKVWEDDVCRKYKRIEHADHWLWNHAFYNADIETLRYIAELVGVRREKCIN